MNPAVEQLQIGRYQIFSQAGNDYAGSSFLARDPETNTVVRLRLYRPEYRLDPAFAANFRKDIPRARTPGHDAYMAQPSAWGYAQRIYPYVTFNQLVGKTWADLLAVRDLNNADMTELCAQAVRSLAAAHTAGLVVGELTPQKLVVVNNLQGAAVRIAEPALGRPRLLDATQGNGENKLGVGSTTPSEYNAPELGIGSEPTPVSDVYGMGALLWEMFTGMRFRDAWVVEPRGSGKSANGKSPSLAEPPSRMLKLPHNMPVPLSAFLQRALASDPSKRFADGGAMYDELVAIQARERSLKARSNPLAVNSGDWAKRQTRETTAKQNRRRLSVAALGLLFVALVTLGIVYGSDALAYIGSFFSATPPTPATVAQTTPAGPAVVVTGTQAISLTASPAATAANINPLLTNTATLPTATPLPPATPTVAAPVVSAAASGVAAQYELRLSLDLDQPTVPVQQVISYTSQQTTPITSLVFRVVPHHFADAFTLNSLAVNNQPAAYTWLDDVNLSVPLTSTGLRPLAPGTSLVVTMDYTLRPLPAGNRFAFDAANRIITLGDWLPTIAPYRLGNPVFAPYARVGDNGIGVAADYLVNIRTAQPLIIAASGNPTQNGNNWTFRQTAARDFALTASDKFLDPNTDQSLTRLAKDGTLIYGYFLPQHRERAARILDLSVAAYDWYGAVLGPRPNRRLNIAEMADSLRPSLTPTATAPLTVTATPLPSNEPNLSITTDQEYPDLYLLRAGSVADEDIKDGGFLWWRALHGPVYQWLYADVATNQYADAWMDEATGNYATIYLVASLYASDTFTKVWADWGNYVTVIPPDPNLRTPPSANSYKPLGAAVNAFAGRDDYFNYVYRQGAAFYRAVRTTMGADKFWAALAAYHKQFNGKSATGRDLLTILQANSPSDLQPLFQQYVGYGSKLCYNGCK